METINQVEAENSITIFWISTDPSSWPLESAASTLLCERCVLFTNYLRHFLLARSVFHLLLSWTSGHLFCMGCTPQQNTCKYFCTWVEFSREIPKL